MQKKKRKKKGGHTESAFCDMYTAFLSTHRLVLKVSEILAVEVQNKPSLQPVLSHSCGRRE
jgi:hypothetical protein